MNKNKKKLRVVLLISSIGASLLHMMLLGAWDIREVEFYKSLFLGIVLYFCFRLVFKDSVSEK
ncbi:MAG: hypothetical protein KatS3mg033_0093 [Thermonema sp.]|nr:MAG: hypothetical protein KatS3mg033_0093 [Thermonema sp.]